MAIKVMVVDDSVSVRQSLKYIVEEMNYSVVEAGNGKEAIAGFTPDIKLVITDINMPEMSGIELVKSIRSGAVTPKAVPIIIITTEAQPEMKEEGKAAGATAWIVKPFKPDELMMVIKKILG
jgi:two-component system, chemotaxis family, chemotaxis protein CheY